MHMDQQTVHNITQQQFSSFIMLINAGQFEDVETILQKSPSIANKIQTQNLQPPLYFAALVQSDTIAHELIKLLIRYGANFRFKDRIEQTILFYVCRDGKNEDYKGKQKCAQLLLSHGLSLDDVDLNGQTPIFYAVSENRLEIVKSYATKERVNHVDNLAAQTPLYYAARRGHFEMCQILIQKGADVAHVDQIGKTAIEFAKKAKYYDISQLLTNELKKVKQISKFGFPSQSIEESNFLKKRKKEQTLKPIRQTYKIVYLNEKGQSRDLTEQDVRMLIRQKLELEGYFVNPETIPSSLIQKVNGQNWEKIALKVLNLCCKLKGSYWFTEPVDPIKFNILDYFDIIEKPMDLGTIRKKMNHNCYYNAQQFVEDMTLIWKNCYKYNGDSHEISICAKELEFNFKQYLTNHGLEKFLQKK